MGAALFAIFLFVSITGLLLTWKKNSFGLILPKSAQGTTSNLSHWLPLDSLEIAATNVLQEIDPSLPTDLDRIDVRPDKGIVKFVFAKHFWELQHDGATGKLLQINQRRSDFIEKIHDGSIVDFYFGVDCGTFKLIYSTISGLSLLLFTITGFWLWYGPKLMRKQKEDA